MTKLLLAIASIAFCIAFASAAITLVTYSDEACTQKISFYSTTAPCLDKKKRAINGNINCFQYYDRESNMNVPGVYFKYSDCDSTISLPATAVPEGWLSITVSSDNCAFDNFTTYAVPQAGENMILVIETAEGTQAALNTTLRCANELSFSACYEPGCIEFENLVNGVCTNSTSVDLQAVQTSCGDNSPMAVPVEAPVESPVVGGSPSTSTPSKSPTATPEKKSSASAAVEAGSALIIFVAAALWC